MVTKPHQHRHKAELVWKPVLIHIWDRGGNDLGGKKQTRWEQNQNHPKLGLMVTL